MRCWDARQHISEYLDGTLDSAVARTVEAPLETCPTCPPLYAALVKTHESMSSLRDPDSVIPPELDSRLRAFLTEPNGFGRKPRAVRVDDTPDSPPRSDG